MVCLQQPPSLVSGSDFSKTVSLQGTCCLHANAAVLCQPERVLAWGFARNVLPAVHRCCRCALPAALAHLPDQRVRAGPHSSLNTHSAYPLLNGCGLDYRAHYYLLDLCYACNLLMLVSLALMLSVDSPFLHWGRSLDSDKLPCMHCGLLRFS